MIKVFKWLLLLIALLLAAAYASHWQVNDEADRVAVEVLQHMARHAS
jgi:hypothetical protein